MQEHPHWVQHPADVLLAPAGDGRAEDLWHGNSIPVLQWSVTLRPSPSGTPDSRKLRHGKRLHRETSWAHRVNGEGASLTGALHVPPQHQPNRAARRIGI